MMPTRAALAFVFVATLSPVAAGAHAVVYPRTSSPGAYERYVLRVPNERDTPTTRIELRFPSGARVVSFGDVPGWTLTVTRDSAQRIVGAIWTGVLSPERFVELPFVAVNPRSDGRLEWPAFQTYADGERVEWTGPEGSDRPASFTAIAAAASASPTRARDTTAFWIAIAALGVALISLVRPMTRRT